MILFLGNMLSKHGLAPAMSELLADKLSKHYPIVRASEKSNMLWRLIDMIWHILYYRKTCNIVIMDVFSTRAFWYAWVCANIMRFVRIEYITILRGGGLPGRIDRNPISSKAIFKFAVYNVCPSIYLGRAFKKYNYPVKVVPNFIELEKYPFRLRDSIRPTLLGVRSFHHIYNPMLALEILFVLRRNYPDARLCMVGPDKDGSLEIVKARAKSLNLIDCIEFTGRLSKTDWISKSSSYDIFINTTNFDNMPVSVLEAMALGFPIISTRVGGIPDLIENGKNGLLVDAGIAEAFVQRIIDLVESPALTRLLSKEARLFAETFSWENVKPYWVELFTENQV